MINRYLSILTDELRAEGIADPLAHPFTLAALWDDLATLAGEALPASVRGYLGDDANESDSPVSKDWGKAISVASQGAGGAVNMGG